MDDTHKTVEQLLAEARKLDPAFADQLAAVLAALRREVRHLKLDVAWYRAMASAGRSRPGCATSNGFAEAVGIGPKTRIFPKN